MEPKKQNNQGIMFRRIRGRIVPIRRNNGLSKEEKAGVKQIAGGTALAAAGAIGAGTAVNIGNKLQRASRMVGSQAKHQRKVVNYNQLLLGESAQDAEKRYQATFNLSKKAQNLSRKARNLRKFGIGVGIAASLVAESLIQAGATPFMDRAFSKDDPETKNVKRSFALNTITTAAYAGAAVVGFKTAGAKKALRIFKTRKP